MRCTLCNSEIPQDRVLDVAMLDAASKGAQRIILAELLKRPGAPIKSQFLLQQIYSGPEGGPLSALNSLAVRVCHLRKKIAPFGFTIHGECGPGEGSYSLIPINAKCAPYLVGKSSETTVSTDRREVA